MLASSFGTSILAPMEKAAENTTKKTKKNTILRFNTTKNLLQII
jgi:hypothetical protein